MKILILDPDSCSLNFAMRSQDYGHEVRVFMPGKSKTGDGLVVKVEDWKPNMGWADLIVLTDNNKYNNALEPFFEQGYPILGANKAGAALELDRKHGQDVLNEHGIATMPNRVFEDYDEAIAYVKAENKAFVSKPWGGDMDKSVSYVANSPEDMIFMLGRWKMEKPIKKGKGQFMLQERVDGEEIGVSGWFGPGGWCSWIEEDWEEKRLMAGGMGRNTGEQGTIMRYVKKSKLFNEMLEPLTQYLHEIEYVGNINVNCIVDAKGTPWPLEFTTRLGWPAFNIHHGLQIGDPAGWLLALVHGRDKMAVSEEIVVGIVLSFGDYPIADQTGNDWRGYPIRGITAENRDQLHFSAVMDGVAPVKLGVRVKDAPTYVTSDAYVMVVTGTGPTVEAARTDCYGVAKQITIPATAPQMYRLDIGERLKKNLPRLQKHGYAIGIRYE